MTEERVQGDDRRWPGAPSIVRSLNFAFEGLLWSLRTQRNMRVHFAAGIVVLALALIVGVSRVELLALLLAIGFVLIAELLNTALEAAIDIATPRYDPLAKVAKDTAAAAVLVASAIAVAVGFLVFENRLSDPTGRVIAQVRTSPLNLSVITLVLVIGVVIAVKAISGRGTPLKGGLPSGHAAVAFSGWAAITFITATYVHALLISSLALLMALLVIQTRVEAGVHTVPEVLYGAVVGTLLTLIVFQIWL